jgi:hypothetical protein
VYVFCFSFAICFDLPNHLATERLHLHCCKELQFSFCVLIKKSSECWAAFSERCTRLSAHFGNNTGACSLTVCLTFGSHLHESSCNLPGVCGPCVLRREKLVSYFVFCFFLHAFSHYPTHIALYLCASIVVKGKLKRFVYADFFHFFFASMFYRISVRCVCVFVCVACIWKHIHCSASCTLQNPLLFCLYS